MILIIGDVHWKSKQPYRKKISEYFDWLYLTYPTATVIFTGDFFDKSNPHSEDEIDEALDYILRFPDVHIVTGNHELSSRTGNPLAPLNRIPNLSIYRKPTEVELEGVKFLLLPYLYNVKKMKEEYETLTNEVDYVVSHVAYPGTNRGSIDEVNLSNIRAKNWFYGHIHDPQDFGQHHLVGVPNTTRHGEQDWQKRLVLIENGKHSFVNTSDFVTFETVTFGDNPTSKDSILNIIDAPSVSAVLKKYKGLHIRLQGVKLKGETAVVTYNEQKEFMNFSLESNFDDFQKDLEIRTPVKSKISELFSLVS